MLTRWSDFIGIILGVALILAVVFGTALWGSYERKAQRALKYDCIERGGTVKEYIGGWTSFACEGAKTFK